LKVAFFDRDGTIIEDYPDEKWTQISTPVFLPGSIQTLKSVHHRGFEIIILTNQYLISEGFISLEQYKNITKKMLNELSKYNIKILDVFYCPHSRDEGCNCIKPKTGRIEQALNMYPTIEIEQSFMVGDSRSDIELAAKMKMKGFGIGVSSFGVEKNITHIAEIKELLNHI
jgi:D-glycero-D-manno-heptose 1,7-bisphosphate phosphatase